MFLAVSTAPVGLVAAIEFALLKSTIWLLACWPISFTIDFVTELSPNVKVTLFSSIFIFTFWVISSPVIKSIRVETYGEDYGLPETLTPFDVNNWIYEQYGIDPNSMVSTGE